MSQKSHKYFIQYRRLLPKDLRFEHGGAILASCPGGHLTSLQPPPGLAISAKSFRKYQNGNVAYRTGLCDIITIK